MQPRQLLLEDPVWEIGTGSGKRVVQDVEMDLLPKEVMSLAHYPVDNAQDYNSIGGQRLELGSPVVRFMYPDHIPTVMNDLAPPDGIVEPTPDAEASVVNDNDGVANDSTTDEGVASDYSDPLLQQPSQSEYQETMRTHGYNL